MKRKLALLMAFMMAATLVPAQPADAASKNTVNKVISLNSNDKVTTDVVLTLSADGTTVEGPENGKTFELHLQGEAKWLYGTVAGDLMWPENATVKKVTDSVLEVTANYPTGTTGNDRFVKIPMWVDLNGSGEGAQKVKVVPKGTTVSEGEYTYATIAGAAVKLRVEKKEKIARSSQNKVSIILDEVTKNSFTEAKGEFVLRLPQGFTWNEGDKNVSDKDQGRVTRASMGDLKVDSTDSRNIIITVSDDKDKLESIYITGFINADRGARLSDVDVTVRRGNVSPSSLVVAEYVTDQVSVKADKVLDVIAGKDVENLYRAKLTIEENVANALLQGRYVEFKLNNGSLQDNERIKLKRLSGQPELVVDSSSSDALAGNGHINFQENVEVEVSTFREKGNVSGNEWDLYVQKASDKKQKGKYELEIPFVVTSDFVGDVVLNVKGAGVVGEAENGGIDVVIAKAKAPVTIEVAGKLPQVKIGLQKQKGADIIVKEVEDGALQDYEPATSNSGSTTVIKETYVRVPDGTGKFKYNKDKDIYEAVTRQTPNQNVPGADYNKIEEHTKVERESSNNRNSKSRRSEFAGYFIKSEKKDFGISFDKAKVEVTDGTLLLNSDKTERLSQSNTSLKNSIRIAVDRKSTKASTIKVSDVELTLDRTVPYGDVKLVGAFGLVDNRHADLTNTTKKFDYLTTVTPVSDDKRITTIFKIGEKSYTEIVGEVKEEKMADVAPFIKDNRTMLPVRYVADAVGAVVNYDPTTRVATFTKDQTVVSINIDKDVMYVNGSPVKLFTKPANVEGRIFLPVTNVAQAFGLKQGGTDENIIWNQENKTVTILPQNPTKEEREAAKAGKVEENAVTKEEMKKEETKTEEKK